jgi:chromosomal replication initiator protein
MVPPAPKPEIIAPPQPDPPPLMVQRYSFKEAWFSIVDVAAPRSLSIRQIKEVVCDHFAITMQEMESARRTKSIVLPRMVAMYLSKELTGKSLPEIGRRFGGRDHTTVLHSVRTIPVKMKSDEKLAAQVVAVRAALGALL